MLQHKIEISMIYSENGLVKNAYLSIVPHHPVYCILYTLMRHNTEVGLFDWPPTTQRGRDELNTTGHVAHLFTPTVVPPCNVFCSGHGCARTDQLEIGGLRLPDVPAVHPGWLLLSGRRGDELQGVGPRRGGAGGGDGAGGNVYAVSERLRCGQRREDARGKILLQIWGRNILYGAVASKSCRYLVCCKKIV